LPQRQQCDAANVLDGCTQPEIGGSAGARRLEQRNFGAVRGDCQTLNAIDGKTFGFPVNRHLRENFARGCNFLLEFRGLIGIPGAECFWILTKTTRAAVDLQALIGVH
jgi:hypothetical protein